MARLAWDIDRCECHASAEGPDGISLMLEVGPDSTPIEGNAMVSGDQSYDDAIERIIRNRLEAGDYWAWGVVTVTARFQGLEGFASLGAVSYDGPDAFLESEELASLVSEAIDALMADGKQAHDAYLALRDAYLALRHRQQEREGKPHR